MNTARIFSSLPDTMPYSKQKGDFNNLDAYRHSKDFIETVQKARRKIPHLDSARHFCRRMPVPF